MNASEIIAKLGGTSKTAELCDVTPSAVSQWIANGIPKPWLKFLRASRPDVFDDTPRKYGRRSTDKKEAS